MRSIIYDVAVTVDGFISAPDGDISAFPMEGDHLTAYLERLQSYATVIMGRATYEFGYAWGLQPGARAYPHMDHHIFSTGIELPDAAQVKVVRDGWEAALQELRSAPGGDIYLCGGGRFAGYVAGLGLIDRLRIKRAPVAIGAGIRLFEGLERPLKLRLRTHRRYDSGVAFEDYVVDQG